MEDIGEGPIEKLREPTSTDLELEGTFDVHPLGTDAWGEVSKGCLPEYSNECRAVSHR